MRVYSPYLACEFPLGPEVAVGGEASIHEVPGHDELLAKIYRQRVPQSEERLDCMLARPPRTRSIGGGYAQLIWPVGKIVSAKDGRTFLGHLMPTVRNSISLEVVDVLKPPLSGRLPVPAPGGEEHRLGTGGVPRPGHSLP